MERERALDLVQEVILKHEFMLPSEYALDSSLKDIGIDSLSVVEMCVALEDELHVTFEKVELREIQTVNDIVTLVESL